MSPRGAAAEAWLLRGLMECGHCHVGCSCHNSYGRHSTLTRYYCCRNHDLLRAGSEDRLCPERNIRATELDEYVFEQVRQALLTPDQLLAAERAVLTGAPDENELVAAQLGRLDTAIEAKSATRSPARRLPSRATGTRRAHPPHRCTGNPPRRAHAREGDTQPAQRGAGRPEPYPPPTRWIQRPRRRLTGRPRLRGPPQADAPRGRESQRHRLASRLNNHLKIPLPNEPPPDDNRPDERPSGPHPPTPGPTRPNPPSSDVRLRSDHRDGSRDDPACRSSSANSGMPTSGSPRSTSKGSTTPRSSTPSTPDGRR